MANLYTQEFFQTVESKLNHGGIFIQWINATQMDWQTMAMIGQTFSSVFVKNCLMVSPIGAGDYFFVGFKNGADMSFSNAKTNMTYSKKSTIMSLGDVRLVYYLILSENIGQMFSDGRLHSDNWPRLEFLAPKNFLQNSAGLEERILKRRKVSSETEKILKNSQNMDMILKFTEFSASLYAPSLIPIDVSSADQTQLKAYYHIIEDYCANKMVDDYTQFADDRAWEICSAIQLKKMKDFLPSTTQKAEVFKKIGIVLARRGEFEKSIQAFEKSLAMDTADATTYYDLAMVYAMQGNLELSQANLASAISTNPFYADAYVLLAKINLNQKNFLEAKNNLKKALDLEDHKEARYLMDQLE